MVHKSTIAVGTGSPNSWTSQQTIAISTLTSSGGSIAWDLNTQSNAKIVLSEDSTLAFPSNPVDGGTYQLKVVQNASSAKLFTFAAGYNSFGGTGYSVSVGLGAVDLLSFYYDGDRSVMIYMPQKNG